MSIKKKKQNKLTQFWKILGPGLITGSSDDDPSGIATYTQAGARFGLTTLWLAIVSFPLMYVIQEMCARIGLVTNKGLAGVPVGTAAKAERANGLKPCFAARMPPEVNIPHLNKSRFVICPVFNARTISSRLSRAC